MTFKIAILLAGCSPAKEATQLVCRSREKSETKWNLSRDSIQPSKPFEQAEHLLFSKKTGSRRGESQVHLWIGCPVPPPELPKVAGAPIQVGDHVSCMEIEQLLFSEAILGTV